MAICAFLFLKKKNPSQYFQFSNVLTVRIRRMFDETWTLRTRGLINYSKKLNLLRIACLRVRSFVHTHRKRERERERENLYRGVGSRLTRAEAASPSKDKGWKSQGTMPLLPPFPITRARYSGINYILVTKGKKGCDWDRQRERERERKGEKRDG